MYFFIYVLGGAVIQKLALLPHCSRFQIPCVCVGSLWVFTHCPKAANRRIGDITFLSILDENFQQARSDLIDIINEHTNHAVQSCSSFLQTLTGFLVALCFLVPADNHVSLWVWCSQGDEQMSM